jgi:hypothetical protein
MSTLINNYTVLGENKRIYIVEKPYYFEEDFLGDIRVYKEGDVYHGDYSDMVKEIEDITPYLHLII